MKRALIIGVTLSFMVPALAYAQDKGRDETKPGTERPAGGKSKPASNRPAHSGKPSRPESGAAKHRPSEHRPSEHRPSHQPEGAPMHRAPAEHHYRPRATEYYHGGHWSGRIHAAPFIYPHGWHYRQWSIGVRLPSIFLVPEYYYPDYVGLGLQAPLPGFAWVRFGPDLLLVNLSTGVVIDVAYGVFF